MLLHAIMCPITPGYGAGVQLSFFVVATTKELNRTEVAHEPIVMHDFQYSHILHNKIHD